MWQNAMGAQEGNNNPSFRRDLLINQELDEIRANVETKPFYVQNGWRWRTDDRGVYNFNFATTNIRHLLSHFELKKVSSPAWVRISSSTWLSLFASLDFLATAYYPGDLRITTFLAVI